ncbi:hypothetical protein FKM82_017662 [Ascaphus truei]
MQSLSVEELKRLLHDTFCDHLTMRDIENIILTEEAGNLGTRGDCPVDMESECHLATHCDVTKKVTHTGIKNMFLEPTDPPDLRAQEPDLRLRHCFHHQRHADRSQSGAAERHEVTEAAGGGGPTPRGLSVILPISPRTAGKRRGTPPPPQLRPPPNSPCFEI